MRGCSSSSILIHTDYFQNALFGHLRIPAVLDVELTGYADDAGGLEIKHLKQELAEWNQKWGHVLRGEASNDVASPQRSPSSQAIADGALLDRTPDRTHCKPVFAEGEEPINTAEVYTFSEDCIVPKAELTEPLGIQSKY